MKINFFYFLLSFAVILLAPSMSRAQDSGINISLKASAISVAKGGTVTLTWAVKGAVGCNASGTWSGLKPLMGSQNFVMTKPSVFYLACIPNYTGTTKPAAVKQSVSVGIIPAPVLTMSASSTQVSPNGGSTITWRADNADGCSASGGWNGNKTSMGSEMIKGISKQDVYQLSCTGPGGQVLKQVKISLFPAPKLTLGISPKKVQYGGNVTVNWSASNAIDCLASSGWSGPKSTSGSMTLNGVVNGAELSMTCRGLGGEITKQGSYSVLPRPAVTLTADADPVLSGGNVNLSWTTSNVSRCVASGSWSGNKTTNGQLLLKGLSTSGNYDLTCTGNNGNAFSTVKVNVIPRTGPSTLEDVGRWLDEFDDPLVRVSSESSHVAAANGIYTLDISHDAPTPYPARDYVVFNQDVVENGKTYAMPSPLATGTVEFWVKGTFTGKSYGLFDNWDATRDHLFVRAKNQTLQQQNVQVACQKAGAGQYVATQMVSLEDQVWNFIVMTWDKSSASSKVYVNGVLRADMKIVDPLWLPTDQRLIFGSGFDGQVRQARVLSIALGLGQVREDMGKLYYSNGTLVSQPISPMVFTRWKQAYYNAAVPLNTSLKVKVEFYDGSKWNAVPDGDLPGNATGFRASPVSLQTLDPVVYRKLRLRADLSSVDGAVSPQLEDWQVTWSHPLPVHPRLYLDQAKIKFIKSRLESSSEPYVSIWREVKKRADVYVKLAPPIYPVDPIFKDVNVEGIVGNII